MKNQYGIQMYSLRDVTDKDLHAAIAAVGQMGYRYVEFAGFFGNSAEDVKAFMDEAGVSCCSTHTSLSALMPDTIEATIAYHKAIGCDHIIIPGAKLETLELIDEFCRNVNEVQPKLAAEGIRLSFHNHSREFEVKPWGSTIHTELEKRTSLGFQIDTYWAFNAGVSPLMTCERLRDRISTVHVKDGLKGGIGRALGEGEAPVRQVIAMAQKYGWRMVVESEGLSPTGPQEVKRCIDFLKSLED